MASRGQNYLLWGLVGAILILGTLRLNQPSDELDDDEWDDEEFEIEDSTEKEDETVYTTDPFISDFVFKSLQETLETPDGKKNASKVEVVVKMVITGHNEMKKLWIVDLATSSPKVYSTSSAKGLKHDCQVNVADADLFKMARGRLHVQSAFLSGKVKLSGNILQASKLKDILNIALKNDIEKRAAKYKESKARNDALRKKLSKTADGAIKVVDGAATHVKSDADAPNAGASKDAASPLVAHKKLRRKRKR